MRKVLLLTACLMVLPGMASAVESCFGCVLGLYGDVEMTQVTTSLAAGTPTDIFLGIKFDEHSAFNGLTGAEFSIAGFGATFILGGFDPLIPATSLGTAPAPADTTAGSTGTGGMNIVWSSCLAGSQAIAKVTVIAFGAVTDKVLQVKHKYPTSNASWQTPIITLCDGPAFTAVRVLEACLVCNPTSTPPACAIGVQQASWESVKGLYR